MFWSAPTPMFAVDAAVGQHVAPWQGQGQGQGREARQPPQQEPKHRKGDAPHPHQQPSPPATDDASSHPQPVPLMRSPLPPFMWSSSHPDVMR